MLEVFFTLKGLLAQAAALWVYITLGAAIAFLGGLFKPWLGYPGVALGGALLMFGVMLGGWASDNRGQVERLKAENAMLEVKQRELRYTGEALRKTLADMSEAQIHNEAVTARLREKLDSMPDNPDCMIVEDVLNELRAIK